MHKLFYFITKAIYYTFYYVFQSYEVIVLRYIKMKMKMKIEKMIFRIFYKKKQN
jgi:hypothetical protein